MTRKDLENFTRNELMNLAKSQQIKGRTKMTRAELVKSLIGVTAASRPNAHEKPAETLEVRGIEPPAAIQPEDRYKEPPLPGPYGETRIVLMVRDPYWLHAYWEVSPGRKDELARLYGGWDRLPLTLRTYDVSGVGPGAEPNRAFDIPLDPWSDSWYIYVGEPERSYCVELGVAGPDGFSSIARSNTVITPRDSVSEIVDEEWMIVDEQFRKLYHLAGMPGGASEALVRGFVSRLHREAQMGSGAVSSISSPMRRFEQARQFWLVLNAELILYGATVSGADVRLHGEPVALRPDGTFAIRMALPDGVLELPVTALSPDRQDSITITPVVSKQTV